MPSELCRYRIRVNLSKIFREQTTRPETYPSQSVYSGLPAKLVVIP